MRLKTRLERLEKAGAVRRAAARGEGPGPPDPPCPPWLDAADWAGRLRVGRCITERLAGNLAADAYLPGMDAAERAYLDGLAGAVLMLAQGAQEVEGPDGAGRAPP
jgi:hypothetical protein